MKLLFRNLTVFVLFLAMVFGFPARAFAATKVDLGTAESFAVLAGTPNITNVPTSVITGDVGLSPASGSGIGLTCAEVTGTIYSVDAAGPLPCRVTNPALLTLAKNDLTAAYLDAAGQTPSVIVPTELGSTTKTPGIYSSTAGDFQITGTLTLDAQGDPDAVFIFQMASTLTTASASDVVLTGGAQACNVFWQVGSSGVLGDNSTFKGTVMALTSLTATTGAEIEGQFLARNGAVVLDSNTITVPTCLAAATPTPVPGLPDTGLGTAADNGSPLGIIVLTTTGLVLPMIYLARKKRGLKS